MKERKLTKKVGTPPGTLIYTGEKIGEFQVSAFNYNADNYTEQKMENVEDCFKFKDSPNVSWIDVSGLYNTEAIEKIGKHYNLHPLTLEDIVNINQRPKLEYFDDYAFIVLKMLTYNEELREVQSEQVGLILGNNFIITFQEDIGDVFDPVRDRIRNNRGSIRKNGADYLLYALIDVVVDNYFIILEKLGEEIDELQETVVINPAPETIQNIHNLRRNLIELRKSVWPLRDVLSSLYEDETQLFKKTSIYFRDVHDHSIQIIDMIETLRDITSELLDVYLSSVNNRMNEIMKVLTIIATIFMPLSFIAGVYGMNFKYMPELAWKYAYPTVLIVMLSIGIGMVIYFKRRKWM